MRVVWIRHGESTANAGLPTDDPGGIELTEFGWEQARALAAAWDHVPGLIVVSPFLRTQQTAQPLRERFPAVPVEVWAIEEFTYLEPSRWVGSTSRERRPSVRAYWESNDPEYRDGPGAESVKELLMRADAALRRLEWLAAAGGAVDHVLLFSHSQFMHAVQIQTTEAGLPAAEKMRLISNGGSGSRFANCARLEMEFGAAGWLQR